MRLNKMRQNTNEWFSSYLYLNSKETKRERENYRNQWSTKMDSLDFINNRVVFFTGVVTGWSRYKKESLYESNKRFFIRLHSHIYSRRYQKIERFVVVEKGSKDRTLFHSHMIISVPDHMTKNEFKEVILESWRKTSNGKKSIGHESFGSRGEERTESFYTRCKGKFSLTSGGYLLKEFKEREDTVDLDNSYWK